MSKVRFIARILLILFLFLSRVISILRTAKTFDDLVQLILFHCLILIPIVIIIIII